MVLCNGTAFILFQHRYGTLSKTLESLVFIGFYLMHKMAQVKRKVMYMCTHTHAKKLAAMENDVCHVCQVCRLDCPNHCDFHNLGVASAS